MTGWKYWLIHALTFFLIFLVGDLPFLKLIHDYRYGHLLSNSSGPEQVTTDNFFYEEYFFSSSPVVFRSEIRESRIIRYTFFILLIALLLLGLHKAMVFAFPFGFSLIRQFRNTSLIALFLGGRAPPNFK
jgi:hypothetical protein